MNKKQLTIIQMNDTHGYLEEHWEHFYKGKESVHVNAGGYARIASYVQKVRDEKDNHVLFLDNGDTFHGTYPVVQTKGKILPPLLNQLNLDGMTAHWDFAYGPEAFQQLVDELNYPMLAINVYDDQNDQLIFPPYLIKNINDLKIGVIGIAATIVDKKMPKHFSEGIYFTMGNEELPNYINELRDEQNVDLVVVLSHLGFPQEIKLAKEVSGIDVLLSGHTHNRLDVPTLINNTLLIQSGCHGSFLGHLDLTIENKKIVDYQHRLALLDEQIKKDPDVQNSVNIKMSPYREKLNQVIGQTETDLNRYGVLESTMDNFLLKSMLDYSKAEIAFSNGWRYGAPIPIGNITENDLWNIIPVNPPLSRTILTGQELWDMLEENLEDTFSRNPYHQMGGYVKRSMGISLYFKVENPYGQRIQELFVGDEEVKMDKEYDVVFVTIQGVPEKYGRDRKDLNISAVNALRKYIKKHKKIISPLTENIKGV